MDTIEQQLLLNKLNEIFAPYPDYVHYVDDLCDKDIEFSSETLLELTMKAATLYSNNFYRQNASLLYPIIMTVNNSYADSNNWETSKEDWKKRQADVIRHEALNVFFMVVYILVGYKKLREISPAMREYTHFKHLKDLVNWE
jgi:hypothetical protein